MSFNTINKLLQFPPSEATIFFTCKNCKLSEIAVNAFIDVKNIVSLDLSHNEITSDSLHPDIFRGPHSDEDYSPINLQLLDLGHNKIKFLDEKLFEHTPNLKKIVLSHNNLESIADGTLQALASCHNLEVKINKPIFLNSFFFIYLLSILSTDIAFGKYKYSGTSYRIISKHEAFIRN